MKRSHLLVLSLGLAAGGTLFELPRLGRARPAAPPAPAQRVAGAAAAPVVSAAAPGFDSERVWGPWNDWEPAVAADPASAHVYQMTTRYNGPAPCSRCTGPWIIFRRSSDGGATWAADQFLSTAKKGHNDPQIEVAADGTIYAAWLHAYSPGVKFTKSLDRGQTWTTPIAISAGAGQPAWSDKPILAISPDGRHVYIAFNASDAWVASSHDFGQSFSRPLKASNDARYWFHTGGAVAPNGDVYFGAVDYSQDYTGDAHVNVQKSTDFAASFTTTRLDASRESPGCSWSAGCYLGFFGPSVALAVDAGGRVVVAYNAGTTAGGAQRMWVRSSGDGGLSWTPRLEVSNGSGTANNAFAALAAAPGADDFRLAWQDDRNGASAAFNTLYRRSTNGGLSWSAAVRLSDLGSGASYKTAAGYAFPYGDYFEIAVDGTGRNHVIWAEGTSYDGPGGTWYTRGQ